MCREKKGNRQQIRNSKLTLVTSSGADHGQQENQQNNKHDMLFMLVKLKKCSKMNFVRIVNRELTSEISATRYVNLLSVICNVHAIFTFCYIYGVEITFIFSDNSVA